MTNYLEGERLVAKAAEIAERAHEGQEHFFGDGSYFKLHLEPIAEITRRLGYGDLYIAAAYLHDVKEDTPMTDDELLAEGIPTQVVHAVNLLAKKQGQPHVEYLAGIVSDQIAIVGKFADSSYNYSWTMLNSATVSDEKYKKRVLEYSHNLSVLRPLLPAVDTENL